MECPSSSENLPTNPNCVFYNMLPSPPQPHDDSNTGCEWSPEDTKRFEGAVAEMDISAPDFFEKVAARIPWKSMEDIKKQYQKLVEDVQKIESGLFPSPEYDNENGDEGKEEDEEDVVEVNETGSQEEKEGGGKKGKRGVPWTDEEHLLFLMGLNRYGKGDWRNISKNYVISKTPTQVASHAQKYYRRQNSLTPVERRRPSIHDIKTVNPVPKPYSVPLPIITTTTISAPINYPMPPLILNSAPINNPMPPLFLDSAPINNPMPPLNLDSAPINNPMPPLFLDPAPTTPLIPPIIPNFHHNNLPPMQFNPNFPTLQQNPNLYPSMAPSSSNPLPPADVYMNDPMNLLPCDYPYMFPPAPLYGNNENNQQQFWG